MNRPSNILDMYVVYLTDEMDLEQQQSNELVILTCSSYVVFDDRSESERARVPTEKFMELLESSTFGACNALIDQLYERKDIRSLRLIQSRLAQNECLTKVTQLLSERKENGINNTKIKI